MLGILSVHKATWRLQQAMRLGISLCIFVIVTGCGPQHQTAIGPSNGGEWQPWQVLDAKTGRVLSPSDWLKGLGGYHIVYVGEQHHNKYHIEAALKILSQLVSDGIQPTIGMEMFGWDGQSALDNYLAKGQPTTKSEFIEQVRWKQNWGGAFEDYEPLVAYARERHLSIRAMNPPRPLIRRVAKLGLEQGMQESEWAHWGMQQEEIVDDPDYRRRIFDQLRRCHGGGTDEQYRTMYEASMVRDEGMAKTLVASLREIRRNATGSRGMILSYTGGGHIQFNLPVPMRVARRLSGDVKYTTIYLAPLDAATINEIHELMRERIADYIWLTPMSEHGPPQRCG
jgi:uncharacterized iron-regulated protein